jgi:hypothetical protein
MALALPLASVALSLVALQQMPNEIVAPALWIFAGIVFIGALDAFAGFIGMAVYCLGAFWLREVQSVNDLRLICGLMMISFGPAMLATASRGIRRPRSIGFADWYERGIDLIVTPLLAAWAAKGLVELLETMSRKELEIAGHSSLIAWVAAGGVALRVVGEGLAAHYFPLRLSKNNLDVFPGVTTSQKHVSMALRIFFFGFLAASFLEMNWYLYAGVAMTAIPWIVSLYKKRYPNSTKLFQLIPAGLPGLLLVLLVASIASQVMGYLITDPKKLGNLSFVFIPFLTGVISVLGYFGRTPKDGDVRWYMRDSNTMIYRVGGVVVLLGFVYAAQLF